MVDPGFLRVGAPTSKRGVSVNLLFGQILPKTALKMKKKYDGDVRLKFYCVDPPLVICTGGGFYDCFVRQLKILRKLLVSFFGNIYVVYFFGNVSHQH